MMASMMDALKPDTSERVQDDSWPGKKGLDKVFWIEALRRIIHSHQIPLGDVAAFERNFDIVAFNSGENPVFWLRETDLVFKFYIQSTAFLLEYSILHAIHKHASLEQRLCQFYCAGSLRPLPDKIQLEDPDYEDEVVDEVEAGQGDGAGNLNSNTTPSSRRPREFREWSWPYVVLRYIPGGPVRSLSPALTREDLTRLSSELAETLRALHAIPLAEIRFLEANRHVFVSWLKEQRLHVTRRLRHNGHLSEHLIAQIDAYIPEDITELVGDESHYVISHGDVNERHVFVEALPDPGPGPGPGPRVLTLRGVIDFDSGGFHERMFELVPLYITIFKCDKGLLMAFLKSYGLEYYSFERARFSYKMMCLTLLFKAYIWDELNRIDLRFNRLPTLKALEEELWALPESFWDDS